LQYSLDTTDPGLLKEFLGGSGQRCRRYVGHLLKSMREAQRLGFKITVRPTLTHQNYASIPALLATLSASLEDPVHIVFGGVTTPGVATDRPLALSQLDWRHVQELIAQLRAQYPALSMEIKTSAYGEKFGEEADINAVHFPTPQDFVECCYCPANRARLYVLPDGRVTFCTMPAVRNALILGHLNHQSIAEVWHSALAQRLAYPSREDCGDSPCRDCSEFTSCHYLSGKCLALVADTYGIDNLHLPDPRCPVKPQAVVC
jgi:radical SAM protein with 4Fe4S-binding SPASM domain